MAPTHSSIATDSEETLRDLVGPDATAGFEADPKFDDTDPAATASSDNVAVQRDTDDLEDSDEEETEAEDEDLEDEDEDIDEEDEDIDEDEEDDEDDEDEDEDVDDEAEATLQTKTFDDLGEEDDDAGDVEAGVDEDDLDDDDLDTDRVADSAIGIDALPHTVATMRIAPSTSARSSAHR